MENNKFYTVSNYIYLNFKQNFLFLIITLPLIILSSISKFTLNSFVPFVLAGTLFLPAMSLLMYSASEQELKFSFIKSNFKWMIKYILRMLFISLIFSSTIFYIFFFNELQALFDPMYLMVLSILSIPILIVTSNFAYYYSQNSDQSIIKNLMFTIHMVIKRWFISIPIAIIMVIFNYFLIFNPITFGLFIPYLLAHMVVFLNIIVKNKGQLPVEED